MTRKNLMAKNMKRLKKQIEREFGKLEAAKYPWIEMSSTANIIPSLSNCASKYIIKSCYAANATVIIYFTINLTTFPTFDFTIIAADSYEAEVKCSYLSLDNGCPKLHLFRNDITHATSFNLTCWTAEQGTPIYKG